VSLFVLNSLMKRKAGHTQRAGKYAKLAQGAYHTGRAIYNKYQHVPKILWDMYAKSNQKVRQKAFYPSTTATATKRKSKSAGGGTSTGPGRSGGFLKTKSRVSKKSTTMSKGYCFSGEYGGIGTSANVGVIGHCTVPIDTLGRVTWGCAIKKLLEKSGLDFDKTSTAIIGMEPNDIIVLSWQKDVESIIFTDDYTATGSESLEDVTAWFNGHTRTWVDDGTVSDQVRFINLTFEPWVDTAAAPYARRGHSALLRLEDTYIHFKSDSNLKIQNRTVVSSGDDEADVNNQPLFGKGYSGPGTGAQWRDVYPASFVAHSGYGLITGDDGTMTGLEDVQDPNTFKGVTRTGKMKLEPGEIKTSRLSSTMRRSFNDMIHATYPTGTDLTAFLLRKLGNYRFFVYEKMLDTGAAYDIVMAFEHAINCSALASERAKKIATVKEFQETKNLTF